MLSPISTITVYLCLKHMTQEYTLYQVSESAIGHTHLNRNRGKALERHSMVCAKTLTRRRKRKTMQAILKLLALLAKQKTII